MVGKKYILKQHFVGEPKDEDFEVVVEPLPEELNENGSLDLI
jgi:hypothetical protein